MKEKYIKYAELLLFKCLSIKKNQPLLIYAPIENIDFIRVLQQIALENNINDIYLDLYDDNIKYNELKYLNNESIKKSKIWNKSIWNKYALKNAAFLILLSDNPDNYDGIPTDKLTYAAKITRESKKIYRNKQENNTLSWCIGLTSTQSLANKIFKNKKNSYNLLWEQIFNICLINETNPIKKWDKLLEKNNSIINKLNNLKIVKFEYSNKLGTKFNIEFKDNIWCGGNEILKDNTKLIVNMPTFEIFTSPNKYSANGIVYASKPLIYNGNVIEDIKIEFKDGKVISYDAKKGKELLKSIIDIKNGNYLGEVSLVDKQSPINKSNILFYETLYDENAVCHLALGSGFIECVKKKDKYLNNSSVHVDFMIGTDDLNIIGYTKDNKKINIMKNGSIVI